MADVNIDAPVMAIQLPFMYGPQVVVTATAFSIELHHAYQPAVAIVLVPVNIDAPIQTMRLEANQSLIAPVDYALQPEVMAMCLETPEPHPGKVILAPIIAILL